LVGEYSSAFGLTGNLKRPSTSWAAVQPWTWAFYQYTTCFGDDNAGWLMIDHKMIQYPINYKGAYLTNNAPFRSNHPGAATFCMADGSVQLLNQTMSMNVYYAMATKNAGDNAAQQ
jgi:prepilin-type processing-associated H-X9-DG protein